MLQMIQPVSAAVRFISCLLLLILILTGCCKQEHAVTVQFSTIRQQVGTSISSSKIPTPTRFTNSRNDVFYIRGGSSKNELNRKKKKLSVFYFLKSFVLTLIDPYSEEELKDPKLATERRKLDAKNKKNAKGYSLKS